MRKLLCLLILLLFHSNPLAQQPDFQVSESASPCLRLRATPESSGDELDCLAPGTRVQVIDLVPYWRKVRLEDGREGWAAKKFLVPAEAVDVEPAPVAIPSEAWLEVHFVDVGQGDGIWIHTYDDGIDGNGIFEGRNIIIDGGPDAADHSNAMLAYVEGRAHHDALIDAMIVSHPHDDHYPGAEGILRHFEVRRYYDPGYPKEGVAYPAFLQAVRQETAGGLPSKVMLGKEEFEALDWGNELRAEILYSYPGNPAGLGSKKNTRENNASIVIRLEYGEHSFLLMGDAEGKERHHAPDQARYVEKILLETVPEKLKSTLLKIGHHGSETSSTIPFLQAVDPEIVVVSSGRKNFNGVFIPDDSTLRRFCCHDGGTRIYRTDQDDKEQGRTVSDDADGDHVVIRTNGSALEVSAFENGEPFTVGQCSPACGQ